MKKIFALRSCKWIFIIKFVSSHLLIEHAMRAEEGYKASAVHAIVMCLKVSETTFFGGGSFFNK